MTVYLSTGKRHYGRSHADLAYKLRTHLKRTGPIQTAKAQREDSDLDTKW